MIYLFKKYFCFGRFLNYLVKPTSSIEDEARREFILNILLIATVFLSFLATFSALITHFNLEKTNEVDSGLSIFLLIGTSLFFLVLYGLSKVGKYKEVAYIFIGIYFLFSFYTSYHWGVYTPQALLIFALTIIMSGILISNRAALIVTTSSVGSIFILTYLQINKLIDYDISWRNKPMHIMDILVYVATLLVIFVVSWLFNGEIEKSLERARHSENALKKEKDLLEVKVKERTQEIHKIQYDKMRQLYRFAEFGRISSGLFHDLINYLSALSLNLEQVKKEGQMEISGAKNYLDQAIQVSYKMESFIEAIQKQIKQQEVKKQFSLNEEVEQVIKIMGYKARKEKVDVIFVGKNSLTTMGNPIKFNQIITNILSNAVDAYEEVATNLPRRVLIELRKDQQEALITIQDWGTGISPEDLSKIFDIFFTTKDFHKGTGIGLSTSRDIINNDFQGTIEVESEKGKGTRFIIKFPLIQ